MKYSQKLKDPRWQRKRLEIMSRDGFACHHCHATDKTLNVHHTKYEGENPWDGDDKFKVTLCEDCHADKHATRPQSVYLAGKIAKNDWRHDTVPGLHRYCEGETLLFGIHNQYRYAGPFFINCDHGCFHGDGSHGRGHVNDHGDVSWCFDNEELKGRLFAHRACLDGIRDCDFFFAWIECETCFGTLVEIGYAAAMGKVIHICCPGKLPDSLWFASKTAWFVEEHCDSPSVYLDKIFTESLKDKNA